MPIYVDDLVDNWCHLWSGEGDYEALDRFALKIGLKLAWCQISYGAFVGEYYHYDLKPSKRALALKHGAVYKPLRDWIMEQRAKEYPRASDNYLRHINGQAPLCSCGERWECPVNWNCPENLALRETGDETE